MVKTSLICTGDSLGEIWPLGAKKIIEHDEFFHYAYGGSGIDLQTAMLLNHYISDGIGQHSIIISQFTGSNRHNLILNDNCSHYTLPDEKYKYVNAISNSAEFIMNESKRFTFLDKHHDSGEARVRNMVAIHCMLADLGANVYVFRGWQGVFSAELWKQCTVQYKKHGVKYTDDTLVETALHIDASASSWMDEFHPDSELSHRAFNVIWKSLND